MNEQKLLTEAELLQALNLDVDRTTVWHWRKAGMPYVKLGRFIRYELEAARGWLQKDQVQSTGNDWPWSVWTWVPEYRTPSGEIEPGFWYEDCRCRRQDDAENIMKLFQKGEPLRPVCIGTTRPTDPPGTSVKQAVAYPKSEEG